LQKENSDLLAKINALNESIEKYQEEEKFIKMALVNSQKVANTTIKEAERKAEEILKSAIFDADNEIVEKRRALEDMQREVKDFRASLLDIYKKHLKLIDALPSDEVSQRHEKENKSEETVPNKDESPPSKEETALALKDIAELTKEDKNSADQSPKFEDFKFGKEYNIASLEKNPPQNPWKS
jgi:cell division initiation protein